ncbi:MAG: polysaccharide biosynthesis C-terminal domain-containing protein [Bacteroidales bacterium]|nr:polysaccharide biosynthesis C-terminal domain-containing protein [Bacteroidales bacterium]
MFINLLVKPFWILGVDRTVQNIVGDASYGTYLAIFNFSYLFYIILDIGLTNYNSKEIAQNNNLLSKYFVGISQAKIFLSIAYFIIIFVIGLIIGYNTEQMKLLAVVGLNQVLLSFVLYVRSNISALLLFKTDSILSVLDRVLMILICSFLLWSGIFPKSDFNIYWFVYSQTVSYVITLIIAIYIVLKHTGKLTIKFNFPFVLMIIKKSLPYALLVLLMSFYNRLEPVLIERILPKDISAIQAGIYARAYRLFDAGNNISYLFSVILLPLFAAVIKKGEDLQALVKQSFGLMLTMTCIIAIVCIFYSQNLMELLYTIQDNESIETYNLRITESSNILKILMGSFVSISVTYIFGTLLTANGNLKQLNIVAAVGVVINLTLNFIFIPVFEAKGAAMTSLCVQFATCAIQFFIAKRIFNLKFGISFWISILSFIILLVTTTSLLKSSDMYWLTSFIISLGLGIVLAFITKMLDFKELKSLLLSSVEHIKK